MASKMTNTVAKALFWAFFLSGFAMIYAAGLV